MREMVWQSAAYTDYIIHARALLLVPQIQSVEIPIFLLEMSRADAMKVTDQRERLTSQKISI